MWETRAPPPARPRGRRCRATACRHGLAGLGRAEVLVLPAVLGPECWDSAARPERSRPSASRSAGSCWRRLTARRAAGMGPGGEPAISSASPPALTGWDWRGSPSTQTSRPGGGHRGQHGVGVRGRRLGHLVKHDGGARGERPVASSIRSRAIVSSQAGAGQLGDRLRGGRHPDHRPPLGRRGRGSVHHRRLAEPGRRQHRPRAATRPAHVRTAATWSSPSSGGRPALPPPPDRCCRAGGRPGRRASGEGVIPPAPGAPPSTTAAAGPGRRPLPGVSRTTCSEPRNAGHNTTISSVSHRPADIAQRCSITSASVKRAERAHSPLSSSTRTATTLIRTSAAPPRLGRGRPPLPGRRPTAGRPRRPRRRQRPARLAGVSERSLAARVASEASSRPASAGRRL